MLFFVLACPLIASCNLFVGCNNFRFAATPLVPDMGERIKTKNKYSVIIWRPHSVWLNPLPTLQELQANLNANQPDVFSDNGLPIVVVQKTGNRHIAGVAEPVCISGSRNYGTALLFSFSGMTLPLYFTRNLSNSYAIVIDDKTIENTVEIKAEDEHALTCIGPVARFVPMPDEFKRSNGNRTFSVQKREGYPDAKGEQWYAALAYGLAVRLKELEDSGKIDVALRSEYEGEDGYVYYQKYVVRPGDTKYDLAKRFKVSMIDVGVPVAGFATSSDLKVGSTIFIRMRTSPYAVKPEGRGANNKPQSITNTVESNVSYRMIDCSREDGSDFSYRFTIELIGEVSNPLSAFRAVQKDFRKAIKEDYLESVAGAEPHGDRPRVFRCSSNFFHV